MAPIVADPRKIRSSRAEAAFEAWMRAHHVPAAVHAMAASRRGGIVHPFPISRTRIWGGIHFRFETLSSFGSCTRLGDYAVDNVLRRGA